MYTNYSPNIDDGLLFNLQSLNMNFLMSESNRLGLIDDKAYSDWLRAQHSIMSKIADTLGNKEGEQLERR